LTVLRGGVSKVEERVKPFIAATEQAQEPYDAELRRAGIRRVPAT
jgi:hypothetical protein